MSEPMKLLEAVAIVLEELETICAEDGDETTYEVTIGHGDMFTVHVYYEGGEAGATVMMPDLLPISRPPVSSEAQIRNIVRRVRAAAHEAVPW